MKSWLAAHAYAFRSALGRFARRPLASLLEAAVLGIALALPLAFLLAVENIRALAARHPAAPEISVYMALDATPADIDRVAKRLGELAGLDAMHYVSKAEASERLSQSGALAEVLEALPANPLPDAFTVRLADGSAGRLEQVQGEIGAWPQVARVQVDSDWARKLDALVRTGRVTAAGLGLILGLAMVAITFNTVRLQMLQHREEIELSRLIGATAAFIRRPYFYFGALQGFFGGAIALALLAAGHTLASRELAELSVTYGFMLDARRLPTEAAGAVLALGASLGLGAAWLCAARRHEAR